MKKIEMDSTKTGMVFEYIRVNGASSIEQIEKALNFDAYTCVHGMKNRGILFSAPVKGSNRHIFEILPRTTYMVTNVKTPKKMLPVVRQRNSHPKTLIQVVCANELAPVFKYAIGARKTVIDGHNTTMRFEHSKTNLATIKALATNMSKDGLKCDVSQLTKIVDYEVQRIL